jgi:hypothetical protein
LGGGDGALHATRHVFPLASTETLRDTPVAFVAEAKAVETVSKGHHWLISLYMGTVADLVVRREL